MVYDVSITRDVTGGVHKFAFQEGDVDNVHSTISCEPDENVMPASGPMSNQNYDFNGVTKIVTVKGVLTDAGASNRVTKVLGVAAPTITTKIQQKIWLECLADGNQEAMLFTSNYEVYSISTSGSITINAATPEIDSNYYATYPATIVATKVFLLSLEFDENAGDVNTIPFNMTLRVSGT